MRSSCSFRCAIRRLKYGAIKIFALEASVVGWNILPGVQVAAYAFNSQVPGPRIRITQGDRVRFIVRNSLPEPTTVHWHGLILPNGMDGPAGITQAPIAPGGSFSYEFTATQAGTFFYHSHDKPDRQQALGLYGALIIDPAKLAAAYDQELVVQLQEWMTKDGYTFPAMPMDGMPEDRSRRRSGAPRQHATPPRRSELVEGRNSFTPP